MFAPDRDKKCSRFLVLRKESWTFQEIYCKGSAESGVPLRLNK
jgi:hypothetical protein